ncbi:hypothetical protein [Rhodoplanes serenus]|uniref:hypothetical protein n=1 Tax=Rhodoplanes serenus TaxID=200615 RepID=UPI00131DAB66|nr:hypothetical protein [Rhodoplanes serenus]
MATVRCAICPCAAICEPCHGHSIRHRRNPHRLRRFVTLGLGGGILFVPNLHWAGHDLQTVAIPLGLLLNGLDTLLALVPYGRAGLVDWRGGAPIALAAEREAGHGVGEGSSDWIASNAHALLPSPRNASIIAQDHRLVYRQEPRLDRHRVAIAAQ